MSMLMQKQLNALLLGKNYAGGLGISVPRLRLLIIIATAILAGTSTAFTGPISFIGITMPHAARGIFRVCRDWANHEYDTQKFWLFALFLVCQYA